MKSRDICCRRNARRFVTLHVSRRAAEALRIGFDPKSELFTEIGPGALSIPLDLAHLIASFGRKSLLRYRGIGAVAVARIAKAFAAHGIAFTDPATLCGPLWREVDDAKHSACSTAKIRDLDFAYWWQDDGYIHVRRRGHRGAEDETFHRVHCRLTARPRLAVRDGKLWWLVDRVDRHSASAEIGRR